MKSTNERAKNQLADLQSAALFLRMAITETHAAVNAKPGDDDLFLRRAQQDIADVARIIERHNHPEIDEYGTFRRRETES